MYNVPTLMVCWSGEMMTEDLFISDNVERKLNNKHSLRGQDVERLWKKYNGITLEDTRENHRTAPPLSGF
jgi:hypothetical protein